MALETFGLSLDFGLVGGGSVGPFLPEAKNVSSFFSSPLLVNDPESPKRSSCFVFGFGFDLACVLAGGAASTTGVPPKSGSENKSLASFWGCVACFEEACNPEKRSSLSVVEEVVVAPLTALVWV